MLSSFRGQRGGGGKAGVFGGCGIAGLKVEVEGTRTTWRAREAAVGLVGDDGAGVVPARKRGAEGMRASLRGLGVWAVTRDFIDKKDEDLTTLRSQEKKASNVLCLVSLEQACGREEYLVGRAVVFSAVMEVRRELFLIKKRSNQWKRREI